ncbi:hypothetical protein PAPYR_10322 [Paratrimastix pyriformis]|uniref:Uncharacterized protein n=1 Tax=Paratrimastix pyriformis TaxID=342808 RepID=A0ABQ8U694_9EUKA|nr:hypothetical protein PAPYR_10322 [Paratrimastix pyriformis]
MVFFIVACYPVKDETAGRFKQARPKSLHATHSNVSLAWCLNSLVTDCAAVLVVVPYDPLNQQVSPAQEPLRRGTTRGPDGVPPAGANSERCFVRSRGFERQLPQM